jgi:hypothetical protein
MKIVQILCTHVFNRKIVPAEAIARIWGGIDKGE